MVIIYVRQIQVVGWDGFKKNSDNRNLALENLQSNEIDGNLG